MSEEEITALAREYAEWITQQEDGDKAYIPAEQAIASAFLYWLCDRYCLVRKRKVEMRLKEAFVALKSDDNEDVKRGAYRLSLLKSIFPEIAKEVERWSRN